MEESKGTFKNIIIIIVLLLVIGGLIYYVVTGKNVLSSFISKDTFTKLDSDYVLLFEDKDNPGLSYQIRIDKDINISVSSFTGCSEDDISCDVSSTDSGSDLSSDDDYSEFDDGSEFEDEFGDEFEDDFYEEPTEQKEKTEYKEENYTLEFSGIKKALIKTIYIRKIFGNEKVKRIDDYIEDSYTQNFIDAVLLKNEKYIKLW